MEQFTKYQQPWHKRVGHIILNKLLPVSIQSLIVKWNDNIYTPSIGHVKWGDFNRIKPIRNNFGLDDGDPVDRYYIKNFLAQHADDIKGRVLEIGDNSYTRMFGRDKVIKSDILHIDENNPQATFTGDLATADHIPSNIFDCIILTQTLHLIYDIRAALITLHRILKPGGVLLVTVPGISQIDETEWGHCWYWSFTEHSMKRLFNEVFPADKFSVNSQGNVLAAVAFLHGLVKEELSKELLDYNDPYYQVSIMVKAVKPDK